MPPANQIYIGTALAEGPGDTLYVSDGSDSRVVKITNAGTASVVAGTGTNGFNGDGGPATSAELNYPRGLAVDSSGNLYIADQSNARIREVGTNGVITTIAGTGSQSNCGNGDGPATQTQVYPGALAIDPKSQLLYFGDACGMVRMITSAGTVQTIGTVTEGPMGMAFDQQGDLFVIADDAVYEFVGATGSPVLVAGQPGNSSYCGDGGPASSACLTDPQGLAIDNQGDLLIADGPAEDRVREITGLGGQNPQITTLAGSGGWSGNKPDLSPAGQASLNLPQSLAVDSTGNVFIGEYSMAVPGDQQYDSVIYAKASGGVATPHSIIYPRLKGPNLFGEMPICNPSLLCRHTAESDPVDTLTGEFASQQTDLKIPGRGAPLALTRSYDSTAASSGAAPGPFGYGWSFSYGMTLSQNQSTGDVTVTQENGAQDLFVPTGSGGYASPTDVLATLVQNGDGSWTFTRLARTKFTFNASGQLTQITDLNGYATTLTYDGQGRLASVTDPEGRSLTFAYDSSNRITQVTDPGGRSVSYSYDGSDNLSSVTDAGGGTTSYGYDPAHRLTTITDPRGNAFLTNVYDGAGRVVSQTDALNRKTTFSYTLGATTTTSPAGNETEYDYEGGELYKEINGVGSAQQAIWNYGYDGTTDGVTSTTDPNGNTTTNVYNSSGDLTSSTNAVGKQTSYTYDGLNDLTSETDPNGVTTTWKYDGSGNLLSVSTPLVGTSQTQTTTYTYGDTSHPGDVTKVTDPDGNTTTLSYDPNGDLASSTDAAGGETTYGYDTIGRRTSMVSPNGNAAGGNPANYTTNYYYDALGDLLKVTDPLNHSTSHTYDADQNLSSETDPDGNKTSYTYDAANQLTTITRADGSILGNSYDADGNLTAQTDGSGRTTSYSYDPLDRLVAVTDPLNRTTTYSHDGDGNLTSVTDPESRTTTFSYNPENWLTGITYSDGQTPNVTYGYDNDGQRTAMTDGTGASSYNYDSLHRLTSTTDGAGHQISYGYDLANNVTSITYPNGKVITRVFDPANRLQSITDWLGGKTTFGYDADSNLKLTTFPTASGNTDSYSYNDADQLTAIGISQGSTTLASLSYTPDPLGQATNETQTGLPGNASANYTYNQLNQLAIGGSFAYSYDKADNLSKVNAGALSYDSANEVTGYTGSSYGYDALGERTSKTASGSTTTYGYDQAGRLTTYTPPTGTPTTYAYNGDGVRTSKTTGTTTNTFTWDQTSSIPQLLGDGQTSYIYGPQQLPIEQINQAGTPSYLHHDRLGSTRLITNQSGTTTGTVTYDPYGTINSRTGTISTLFRWAGQYTDLETGFQYDSARYYDPATYQFITRDPIDQQTRQAYSYTNGNPINSTDPSGLAQWIDGLPSWGWGGHGSETCVGSTDNCFINTGTAWKPRPRSISQGIATATTQPCTSVDFADEIYGGGPWPTGPSDEVPQSSPSGSPGGTAGGGGVGGYGNIGGGTIAPDDVIPAAETWLGEYRTIAEDVFRSLDGLRQFRMTPDDLEATDPHVHFEAIGPDGREIVESSHVYLRW